MYRLRGLNPSTSDLTSPAVPQHDEIPVSQWWPWRWLFWRRVGCHFRNCGKPAIWKCIWGERGSVVGDDFARDPLCASHGHAGKCPTDSESRHVSIPESQRWRRVHLRIRIRWEEEGD